MTFGALNKDIKSKKKKKKKWKKEIRHGHNLLGLFYPLPKHLFPTSETKCDYSKKKMVYTSCLMGCWAIQNLDVKKSGNLKKKSKNFTKL